MAGTVKGGKKAAETNRLKFGADFYSRLGKLGGKSKNPKKGFGTHRDMAPIMGKRGGHISKRRKHGE